MNRALALLITAALLAAPGCAAPEETAPLAARVAATEAPPLWNLAEARKDIMAASCEAGDTTGSGFSELDLSVAPLNAKQAEVLTARLPKNAKLAGAWELSASDPNFGGLSGIALDGDNSLLAVTDSGGWVTLSLEKGVPVTGGIAYMRGQDGKFLSGKWLNDAEDIAYRDGIALVSFERDFRIEAFAIGSCGAQAKAVKVAGLPSSYDGKTIDDNEGPEAMTLLPDGSIRFGYEGATGSVSPFGHVLASGEADWTGTRAPSPSGFALVSMATVALSSNAERTVYLYRSFDPFRGARSVLTWGEGDAHQLTLSRPVMTDNFEGMAVQPTGPGTARIWIVSDNNFTKLQRTLLYAFDVSLD